MPAPSLFGQRLRTLRETRKLSQVELGERAGIPALMISHFETGVRPSASAATLVKLANALEISIDYLMARSDDPMPVGGRVGALLRSLGENASKDTIDAVITMAEAMQKRTKSERQNWTRPRTRVYRSQVLDNPRRKMIDPMALFDRNR
jgi:transcriptional regulator with XRE-family HTH domain